MSKEINKKTNMVRRDDIVNFCKEFLNTENFQDYYINGLQVEGAKNVSKIVTGVTWCQELFDYAIDTKAEMVLVHHGIYKEEIGELPAIKGYVKGRLLQLLKNDISLCGFHLPLDAHPKIGNNAIICDLLEIKDRVPCSFGFVGNLKKACTVVEFKKYIKSKLGLDAKILKNNSSKVLRIGVISGSSSSLFTKAAPFGIDSFICGDIHEGAVRAAEEMEINLIGLGHYNSETFGIKRLGEEVAKKFNIEAKFFDVPNEF
ncbi:MAG: Nif3-like dinuclear metal center hexameric protein [Bdellovibrionota bacterium]